MKKETKASILKFFTAIVLMVILVFVIAYQNRDRSLDGVINIFGSQSINDARGIEGYGGAVTAPLGSKAVLVTTNTFLLMDENGRGESKEISVANPELWVCGSYALVYDGGGKDFTLYEKDTEVYRGKSERPIISAKVNKNGYVIVAAEDSGGQTEINVYNSKGTAFYSWNLGSGEFIDMDLCADNSRMVISSVADDEEELRGELTVVRLDREKKLASGFKTDEIYFSVVLNRDYTVTALGSEQLDFYNSDASLRWSLSYDGKLIRCADIRNPDMLVLCYAAADSGLIGNSTHVELINRMGEITASVGFDGLCEQLSVNGDRFAASAGKQIYVYNSQCRCEREYTADSSVKRLALLKNGKSVFVLSGSDGNILGN